MSSTPKVALRLRVDPTNPGQFFACCGLLELADRAWQGAEGWFEQDDRTFCLVASKSDRELSPAKLLRAVSATGLQGELSVELRQERERLEAKKRELGKEKKTLTKKDEERRKKLGGLLRSGNIRLGQPFNLLLDWWQDSGEDCPKTWAGSQAVLRIAQAALAGSSKAFESDAPFHYYSVMRPAHEGEDDEGNEADSDAETDKVEPFYFDSNRGAHAHPLDIGFSPNAIKQLTLKAAPALEFLCLVGLQRHRPQRAAGPRVFDYWTWSIPLATSVTQAAVAGFLSQAGCRRYRFCNEFRTDQRKHKGFTSAKLFPE